MIRADYFKSKPVNIAKITIVLDHRDHPRKLQQALEEVDRGIMRKIKFQLSAKPSTTQKAHRHAKQSFASLALQDDGALAPSEVSRLV